MVQIWSRSRENTIILKQTLQIYKVSVHPFEVGSHTGNITRENKERIARLHKLCKREVKFKNFKNNHTMPARRSCHNAITFIWGFRTSLLNCFIYQTIKRIEQAGAELCQAQVKLEVILEVGMEFGDELEACHY